MKLSEEELDSWFLELSFEKKKDFYRIWYNHFYGSIKDTSWEDLFKCESDTPEHQTLADEKDLSELYDMAVNKYMWCNTSTIKD